jgi:hypothetical protein
MVSTKAVSAHVAISGDERTRILLIIAWGAMSSWIFGSLLTSASPKPVEAARLKVLTARVSSQVRWQMFALSIVWRTSGAMPSDCGQLVATDGANAELPPLQLAASDHPIRRLATALQVAKASTGVAPTSRTQPSSSLAMLPTRSATAVYVAGLSPAAFASIFKSPAGFSVGRHERACAGDALARSLVRQKASGLRYKS